MNITLDISPLEGKGSLQHRVRGTGFYVKNLKAGLIKYYPENNYSFITREDNVPKDTDVVHYPYFEPFFLTMPWIQRKKSLITVHDLTPFVFPKNFPAGIKGNLKWIIQKNLLKKANRIITDSSSSKKDIIKYGGISESKIDIIHLAHGEIFRKKDYSEGEIQKILKKYDLPRKFVLYVGDATWNKNLPRLIKASLMANVPLVMTGKALLSDQFDKSNPWNQDLAKVQEISKKSKNIRRIGFVEDDDLVCLYNIAEVMVMPSLYEGFGLPILESMACGCPVITSREGSIPEVAGDSAFYVDPYDEASIAYGIQKVFSDFKLKKKLSVKGLDHSKFFSWKIAAGKTLDSYRKVMADEKR